MTKETSHRPPPSDAVWNADHASASDDVAELASMLTDAYDAPPVPTSLVQRLDHSIEAQWGESPGLIQPRFAEAAVWARAGKTWFRSLSIAAAIAAALMLAFLVGGGSKSYAWAAVIDAITRHGIVQIDAEDETRWLELSQRVVGQKTDLQTRWIDLRQQVVLTHKAESNTLFRSRLAMSHDGGRADPLLVAFLLGQPLSAENLQRLSGVEVVSQQWDKRTDNGREVVDLRVDFQTPSKQRFWLSLRLDPESKLPLAVQATENDIATQPIALAYPNASAQELQAMHFPSHLAVVDASDDTSDQLASLDQPPRGQDLSPSDARRHAVDDSVPSETATDNNQPSERSLLEAPSPIPRPTNRDDTPPQTLPLGPANKWSPVAVIPRTEAEVLERVDVLLEELWNREQIRPVAAASDLDLLRRAFLDLSGRTPTVTEVRRFLTDEGADRYQRLVDELLDSPDHASHFATVWRSFLIPDGVDLDAFGGREAFDRWLAARFVSREPYDQIVRKLLLVEGRLSQSGPLLFYSALKLDADQLASRTSRAFLGMRMECAQCHNHPFEPWTQEDFWSFAAFFARIPRPKGELENVSTIMRVRDVDRGDVTLPETETVVLPRFLGDRQGQHESAERSSATVRRKQLANWLTGPQNPYFARATVNRVWAHLLGRGIVDPVDNFGLVNPAVSPELLDTLASQFIDSGFDLKTLIRSIALSRAYRLSSSSDHSTKSDSTAQKRLETFAQVNVKTLTAEQLYDCIAVATMMGEDQAATSQYSLSRFGNSQRDAFLQQFSAPATNRAEYLAGIPQALTLMNGSLITRATGEQSSGLIQSLQAPFFTDRERIDVLFMSTLSRPASADEIELLAEFVPADASQAERSMGLSNLLWALINSAEFTLNH